jgi:O-antigen/teichoic acid export membrane protein
MSWRAVFERFARSRWVVNTAKLGGGTAVAQLLLVAATPIVTRLYTPEDLGLLGLFISFVGFASVAVALRYDLAIISAADDAEADALLATSLGLSLGGSLLGGFLMAALTRFDLLSYGVLPPWASAGAAVALAATGVFTALRCWHVRRTSFGAVGQALVYQAAGRATVPVALGFGRVGWLGLMLGEIAGRAVGIGQLMRVAWPAVRDSVMPFRSNRYRSALRRNWKYPAMVLPSSMVDALAVALPLPIVSSVFGTAAAGQFLLVMRVAGWPASLVGASVADVFHEGLAGTARIEPGQVPSLLWASARHLSAIGVLIYLPVALLSPFAFGLVFGAQWRQAGTLTAWLSPYLLAALVTSPLSRLLLVVNRQEWKLVVDLACLAVPVAAFYGGQRAGLGFLPCVALFSGLNVLAYAFYFAVIVRAARSFSAAASYH